MIRGSFESGAVACCKFVGGSVVGARHACCIKTRNRKKDRKPDGESVETVRLLNLSQSLRRRSEFVSMAGAQ